MNGGFSFYSYVHDPNKWVDTFGLTESCDSGELTKEEALQLAQDALDEEIEKLEGLSNTQKSEISTMVGATSLETGETTVGIKRRGENYGMCAEDIAAQELGGDSSKIVFTEAYRPRTEKNVPVCTRCQTKYTKDQFPEGTKFD